MGLTVRDPMAALVDRPREVEHDSQIDRDYEREAKRLEERGARVATSEVLDGSATLGNDFAWRRSVRPA
jgi:hypothetical protein